MFKLRPEGWVGTDQTERMTRERRAGVSGSFIHSLLSNKNAPLLLLSELYLVVR